jgi:hypothetical protein
MKPVRRPRSLFVGTLTFAGLGGGAAAAALPTVRDLLIFLGCLIAQALMLRRISDTEARCRMVAR